MHRPLRKNGAVVVHFEGHRSCSGPDVGMTRHYQGPCTVTGGAPASPRPPEAEEQCVDRQLSSVCGMGCSTGWFSLSSPPLSQKGILRSFSVFPFPYVNFPFFTTPHHLPLPSNEILCKQSLRYLRSPPFCVPPVPCKATVARGLLKCATCFLNRVFPGRLPGPAPGPSPPVAFGSNGTPPPFRREPPPPAHPPRENAAFPALCFLVLYGLSNSAHYPPPPCPQSPGL